ncbi:MAG: hypothetical protein LBN93_06055 [Candidatus Symbiothrix sp.]|jgi:hypothetical protein|nr:hypothetical protein [Candidatus Symbiothrix sp.]
MIKIYPNTKVYVYAPLNYTTGGAELLHQLVHCLNSNNIDSYIVYFDRAGITKGDVPQAYSKYMIKVSDHVEDTQNNIIVIYEGEFNKMYLTQNAQKLLWWLSVDNFFLYSISFLAISDLMHWNITMGIKQLIKRSINKILRKPPIATISIKQLVSLDALHCYQSEYAQNFLENRNVPELLPLSDFINSDFSTNNIQLAREKKVLYNPAKGFKYTSKLIRKTPEITWVPLVNLTREQLINEFKTSMLYVDFGYHPGKDRIPREAAINGCCILTNKAGSAKFFEDVAILKKYKIDEKNTSVKEVINRIKFMLDHYDKINEDFDFYRNRILKEKEIFEQQVKDIFQI